MAPKSLLSSVFNRPGKKADKDNNEDDTSEPREPSPVSVAMRTIQPADPTRPSVAALSDDLILYILEIVQDVSPSSTRNCMLVCSSLYHHARQVQHRELSIDFDDQDSIICLDIASKDNLLPGVRALKVSGNSQLPSTFNETFQKMTGLRNVEWSAATITEPIIQTLQSSHRTELEVLITKDTRHLLPGLVGNTALVSISVNITYASAEDCMQVTQPLKQVLLSCPNLRSLSLNLARPNQGCVATDPPAEYVGIGFAAGERPPLLQELRISSYPWGYKSDSPNGGGVNCVGYPEEGLEMDYWVTHFDWSRLTHFEDVSFMFANKVVKKLTALKHVRFYNGMADIDKEFFQMVPSALESIDVPDLDCTGINGLKQHATSLRNLYIHQPQLSLYHWRQALISDDDLASICKSLPQLREVGIDLARDGNNWPHTTFDILTTLPHLQRLEIWFELGHTREAAPTPYLTMYSAYELFGYLSKRSSALRNLHLHSGCPSSHGNSGFMIDASNWSSENATSFVCEHSARDDDTARGGFRVTCPKLSNQLNRKAQSIIRGQEELRDPVEYGVDFMVALQGPIPFQEWRDLWRGVRRSNRKVDGGDTKHKGFNIRNLLKGRHR